MRYERGVAFVAMFATLGGLAAVGIAAGPMPKPFICLYGHSDDPGATRAIKEIIPPFTVIEGTSRNADFIRELRDQGKVYAAHVNNPAAETAAQLYDRWRAPFEDTLGGRLPGGYDAIAIDELHAAHRNGTAHSDAVVDALRQLRENYPTKGVYVAAVWSYGGKSTDYSDQLEAVNRYAEVLMLEVYIREGNPSYGWLGGHHEAHAGKLAAAVPGILTKTVYGLYIPQGAFVADDSTDVGFWGHLDEQFHRIRNDPAAATMPGVMFWVYYQCRRELTPDYVARLVDHYFLRNNTGYFGDGNTRQLVGNPQFETLDGWACHVGEGGSVEQLTYASAGVKNHHDQHQLASHGSHGLKMVRGQGHNEARFEISGLDTTMLYTVSAWVVADAPGRHDRLAVRAADGADLASKEIDDAGSQPDWYWKWNEWSRLIFHFAPTSDTITLVLSDEPTKAGAVLYWDFIELE